MLYFQFLAGSGKSRHYVGNKYAKTNTIKAKISGGNGIQGDYRISSRFFIRRDIKQVQNESGFILFNYF